MDQPLLQALVEQVSQPVHEGKRFARRQRVGRGAGQRLHGRGAAAAIDEVEIAILVVACVLDGGVGSGAKPAHRVLRPAQILAEPPRGQGDRPLLQQQPLVAAVRRGAIQVTQGAGSDVVYELVVPDDIVVHRSPSSNDCRYYWPEG